MTDSIVIPGYQMQRTLGRGGMATVYLAVQESFGRQVALKLMSPLLNNDPSFSARFKREARIVSQINHASIVPVFDVGEYQSHQFLSMEYLPGGDLRQRILTNPGAELAVHICMAISSALDLAHRKGFVHRDIKPENILFREDGTPVLTDFGIARAFHANATQTMAGMLVGTPNYMSPEQIKAIEIDGRSDLYSLGIVFYEMLTGAVPFRTDSSVAVAIKHLNDPIPRLPPEFNQYQVFLDHLTEKDPAARFASGVEVMQALRTLAGTTSGAPPVQATLPRATPEAPDSATTLRSAPVVKPAKFKLDRRWSVALGAIVVTTLVVGAELLIGGMHNSDAGPGQTANAPAQGATMVPASTTTDTPAPAVELAKADSAPAEAQPQEATTAAAQPEVQQQPRHVEPAQPRVSPADAAANRKQIEQLLAAADEEYIRGSLTEAMGHYRAALKLDPQQADALAGVQRVNEVLASRGHPVSSDTPAGTTAESAYYPTGGRPYGSRYYKRERHDREQDTPPPKYDGNFNVPTPNVPAPTFHPDSNH